MGYEQQRSSMIKKTFSSGTTIWFNDEGRIHRDDGPAVEWAHGVIEWRQNGLLHRLDGPACIFPGRHSAWMINGEMHRVDGPAIEYAHGECDWYLHNVRYSYDNWLDALPESLRLVELLKCRDSVS